MKPTPATSKKSELPQKGKRKKSREVKGFKHNCKWRKAALKLAKCVITTLQTDGKIGMGTGLVMSKINGKRVVERWDKDFIEALAFIGIEVTERKSKARSKSTKPAFSP